MRRTIQTKKAAGLPAAFLNAVVGCWTRRPGAGLASWAQSVHCETKIQAVFSWAIWGRIDPGSRKIEERPGCGVGLCIAEDLVERAGSADRPSYVARRARAWSSCGARTIPVESRPRRFARARGWRRCGALRHAWRSAHRQWRVEGGWTGALVGCAAW